MVNKKEKAYITNICEEENSLILVGFKSGELDGKLAIHLHLSLLFYFCDAYVMNSYNVLLNWYL